MKITKHALERYHERFGRQDINEIKRRALNSRLIREEDGGRELRSWGAIVFVVAEETIITVMQQYEKFDRQRNYGRLVV